MLVLVIWIDKNCEASEESVWSNINLETQLLFNEENVYFNLKLNYVLFIDCLCISKSFSGTMRGNNS